MCKESILLICYCISLLLIICISNILLELDNLLQVMIAISILTICLGVNVFCYANNHKKIKNNNKKYEETMEEKYDKNHISFELVQAINEYSNKNEDEIFTFLTMVADDEMDLKDAIHYIDGTLSENDIDAILRLTMLKEKQNENN